MIASSLVLQQFFLIPTVLTQVLTGGRKNKLGFFYFLSGFFGALVVNFLRGSLDFSFRCYNLFITFMLFLSVSSFEYFTVHNPDNDLQAICFVTNGFFQMAFLQLTYRHAAALTPRYSESIPNGLINSLANFFGFL